MAETEPISENDPALTYHRGSAASGPGKLAVVCTKPFATRDDLGLAYTPGVAKPCLLIDRDPERVWEFTSKGNMVAVISDSTAVLGLGTLRPEGGLPVMEGKSILFKMLAGVDSFPLCLKTQDPDTIVEIVRNLEPSLGGVNLEDISAPRCFDIESRLKKEMGIPVFHDDQHGTAIVTLAGLINSLRVAGKKISDVRIVFNGAGAAALACAKMYMAAGVRDVIMCDTKGTIYAGRKEGMNPYKEEMALVTNREGIHGSLADAMKGADIFVGLSAGNVVSEEMVASMADRAIVFACANPTPEIMPDKAKAAGALVVATGRSDFPNQVNNVLGFPGIFRGALDVRARDINEEMKLAAARALSGLVSERELEDGRVIVAPLDARVAPTVASAVAKAAMDSGVARIRVDPEDVFRNTVARVEAARRLSQALNPQSAGQPAESRPLRRRRHKV
jgi:malate dehydrogenase (oxaloacetate-decarboxylating)